MKVYVITQGSYSDYHICAVSLDKDEAERLARIYSDGRDEAEVEEYDTERPSSWREGQVPFIATFLDNGAPILSLWDSPRPFTPGIEEIQSEWGSPSISVRLYARDRETARKIAQDKRAEYLAQKAGI